MPESVTGHGGKREGAGRPTTRGETKETTSMRLTPTLKAYLAQCDQSAGDVVEDTIRRTAAFKKWLASRG